MECGTYATWIFTPSLETYIHRDRLGGGGEIGMSSLFMIDGSRWQKSGSHRKGYAVWRLDFADSFCLFQLPLLFWRMDSGHSPLGRPQLTSGTGVADPFGSRTCFEIFFTVWRYAVITAAKKILVRYVPCKFRRWFLLTLTCFASCFLCV